MSPVSSFTVRPSCTVHAGPNLRDRQQQLHAALLARHGKIDGGGLGRAAGGGVRPSPPGRRGLPGAPVAATSSRVALHRPVARVGILGPLDGLKPSSCHQDEAPRRCAGHRSTWAALISTWLGHPGRRTHRTAPSRTRPAALRQLRRRLGGVVLFSSTKTAERRNRAANWSYTVPPCCTVWQVQYIGRPPRHGRQRAPESSDDDERGPSGVNAGAGRPGAKRKAHVLKNRARPPVAASSRSLLVAARWKSADLRSAGRPFPGASNGPDGRSVVGGR